MNLKRRVLSLLLSVSIGMTFIPVMAFAGDGAAEPDTQTTEQATDQVIKNSWSKDGKRYYDSK